MFDANLAVASDEHCDWPLEVHAIAKGLLAGGMCHEAECETDMCTVVESTKCGGLATTKNWHLARTVEDGRSADAPGGLNVLSTAVEVE